MNLQLTDFKYFLMEGASFNFIITWGTLLKLDVVIAKLTLSLTIRCHLFSCPPDLLITAIFPKSVFPTKTNTYCRVKCDWKNFCKQFLSSNYHWVFRKQLKKIFEIKLINFQGHGAFYFRIVSGLMSHACTRKYN